MKKILFLTFILLSNLATASFDQSPSPFKVGAQRAVWIDFDRAHYDIEYNTKTQVASVTTTIEFTQSQTGHPLFDLVNKPSSILINGTNTSERLISVPGKVSKVRMVQKRLEAGHHTLSIISEIKKGVRFKKRRRNKNSVSSAFFIRDLKDRMFLEKYLPTNLEFDQYQMIMDVTVTGTKRTHSLFTNGNVDKVSKNKFHVEYPKFYTASSVFFHLVPITKYVRWYTTYKSIDGRELPFTIYSKYRFYNYFVKKKAVKVLKELEADYGPWPHDKILIYGTGIKGGMEYAGATETSIVSLGHELQHSYFAKGIHPANGNSGWLDEAIASWRDKGHLSKERPFYDSVNLGAHNSYTRKTDKRSYEYGRSFMAYINYQLKDIGKPGLKDFLNVFIAKRMHTTVTTEDFKADLEDYSQMSFTEDFAQYIYGGSEKLNSHQHKEKANPHHPVITQEELDSII
jgi:hypothetical protein